MDFLKLVETARTCRRFVEDEPLSIEDIHWLVKCASYSPSARNAQELRFVCVAHGDVCDKLFTYTRWAGALKDWKGPYPGERPTAFIAVLMPERGGDLLCYDTGIACQTIQLAATSRGWGACIIQSFDRKESTALLNIPEGLKIALVIGLGVAKEIRMIAPMPANGSFMYWRNKDGVHFVPKRSLDELIIANY